jgi:hypothetical protein
VPQDVKIGIGAIIPVVSTANCFKNARRFDNSVSIIKVLNVKK